MPRTEPTRPRGPIATTAGILALAMLTTSAILLAGPAPAPSLAAVTAGGGLSVPASPKVLDVVCLKQCVSAREATPGATVKLKGANLDYARRVVFPGRTGPAASKVSYRSRGTVKATLPKSAVAGRPYVIDANGKRSNKAPRKIEVLPASAIPTEAFPVLGPVDFGSSGARFGAGRSGHTHQGQDLMAACGTKIVSVRKARIVYDEYQSAAGNYVVAKNFGSNTYFAYMHMLRPSPTRVGQVVGAGQVIGNVGSTGSSTACHLHFEYWRGPWQQGGTPIDPYRFLKGLLAERRG